MGYNHPCNFLTFDREGGKVRLPKEFCDVSMCTHSQLRQSCLIWCVVSAVWLAGAYASFGMVDLNGDGMSDIWEWTHSKPRFNPVADPDRDGFSNLQESIAGTDPFDSNSYPRITAFASTATNFSVTFPCALGKVYQLLSAATPGT